MGRPQPFPPTLPAPLRRTLRRARTIRRSGMTTYVYYVAERVAGAQEMQRFAQPIHVGLVSAADHEDAYSLVLDNLKPTFEDSPQPLEIRFEALVPPRGDAGVWRHSKPIDMDITFSGTD